MKTRYNLTKQTNNKMESKTMKLDLEKCPIVQLKSLINNINDAFHNSKMNNDLPKFVQLRQKSLGKNKYSLNADQLNSGSFKIIKTKEMKIGNKYDLTHYVFDKFFIAKEIK